MADVNDRICIHVIRESSQASYCGGELRVNYPGKEVIQPGT